VWEGFPGCEAGLFAGAGGASARGGSHSLSTRGGATTPVKVGQKLLLRRMFWLLRFRGERLWDTLALWINAIVWQVHKLLYRLFHPSATKQDFVRYIISRKLHLHWTNYPFNLKAMYYHDGRLRLWLDAVGITWVYFTRPGEHPEQWLDSLGPGQIGLDVGAHRGYWTLLYQKRVLPGGLIFAWEPDPENYQILLLNLAKNKLSHVIPLRLAAWRESTLLTLSKASEEEISSFLSKVQVGENGHTLAVSVDSLVESLSLPRLDWIKMDIEGAEVEALRGSLKTLLRYKPILWVEFHDTLEELKELLAEANYEIKGEVHHEPTPQYQQVGYLWAVAKGFAS